MMLVIQFSRVRYMKMLSVRLDDKKAAKLDAVCEAQGVSRSEVVKRAIRDLAQAGRHGAFGRWRETWALSGVSRVQAIWANATASISAARSVGRLFVDTGPLVALVNKVER